METKKLLKKALLGVCFLYLGLLCSSCKKSLSDYKGVYQFLATADYLVVDTSESVFTMLGRSPVVLKTGRLTPMKIDLFMSGEDIMNGTLSVTTYQRGQGFDLINETRERKTDLKNIHLVNDTLVAEMITDKKRIEFKFSAATAGSAVLFVPMGDKEREKEKCNRFSFAAESGTYYKEIKPGSIDSSLIIESNRCFVEKSVLDALKKGYTPTKQDYLKALLMKKN